MERRFFLMYVLERKVFFFLLKKFVSEVKMKEIPIPQVRIFLEY